MKTKTQKKKIIERQLMDKKKGLKDESLGKRQETEDDRLKN